MTTIRHEKIADIAAREALLDAAFGPGRTAKTAERLREGPPAGRWTVVRRDRAAAAWSAPCGFGTSPPATGMPGTAARPAGGRRRPARPRHRRCADAPRAARPRSGSAMRAVLLVGRCSLLRPLRLLGPRRPGRCGCPAPTSVTGCSACELVPGALDGADGPDRGDWRAATAASAWPTSRQRRAA